MALSHFTPPHLVIVYACLTCSEWATNQHRDSIASHLGHSDIINFFAVAQNQSQGRVRYELMVSVYNTRLVLYIRFDWKLLCEVSSLDHAVLHAHAVRLPLVSCCQLCNSYIRDH